MGCMSREEAIGNQGLQKELVTSRDECLDSLSSIPKTIHIQGT